MRKTLWLAALPLIFLSSTVTVSAQIPKSADLISIFPTSVWVGPDELFRIQIRNVWNKPVTVFCFSGPNITRVNATFLVMLRPDDTVTYSFRTPKGKSEPNYMIVFVATDPEYRFFQWGQVWVKMFSRQELILSMQTLQRQNELLTMELDEFTRKASYNNMLSIALVGSNVFWGLFVLLLPRLKRKPSST